ncbi:MAG: hypothetical protein R3F13_03050 [Prosthecobacter sp.]
MQAVCGELHLFVPAQFGITGGIHADAVAAECGGGVEPLEVVLDGFGALRVVGIAEIAFAVAHDEQAFHAFAFLALLHFAQVGGVGGLVEEHLIYILHTIDPEAAGYFAEVEVLVAFGVAFAKDALIQRPFRQRDLERWIFVGGDQCRSGDGGSRGRGGELKEAAAGGGGRAHVEGNRGPHYGPRTHQSSRRIFDTGLEPTLEQRKRAACGRPS